MGKPLYLQHDNLDDRREFVRLLDLLPPAERVAWLAMQCRRSALPNSAVRPRVARSTLEVADLARRDDSASERLTVECFFDVFSLAMQYGLDLDAALADLVAAVRRRGVR